MEKEIVEITLLFENETQAHEISIITRTMNLRAIDNVSKPYEIRFEGTPAQLYAIGLELGRRGLNPEIKVN